MKKSSLPSRGQPLARSKKPIKKKARSKSERERIYGPKGFVEWIHEQPCVACGWVGDSQCAHIHTGGMGRKDDWTRTVPLCFDDHDGFHSEGRTALETFYDINLDLEAAETQRRWQVCSGTSNKD